jgi:hypothetical protein
VYGQIENITVDLEMIVKFQKLQGMCADVADLQSALIRGCVLKPFKWKEIDTERIKTIWTMIH